MAPVMEYVLGIAVLVLAAVATGLLAALLRRSRQAGEGESLQLLQQQMGQTAQQIVSSVQSLTTDLNTRLGQTQNLAQQSQQAVTERLTAADRTLGDLKGQLGQLTQATQQLIQVGGDVRKLQDILQSPKLRGNLGEWSLENLLAEVLPRAAYRMQHTFAGGTKADALVQLSQGAVAIDAKFPLTNFRALLEAPDEAARTRARKALLQDVRKHIDTIAAKYILPNEGTLDFALMYVPAENVYYELLMGDEDDGITQHARQRKVILVSPNTLYAYLMTIVLGLRGLQVEQSAKRLYGELEQVRGELGRFMDDFTVIGRHLGNAQAKHDEARRKLEQVTGRLEQMHEQTNDTPGGAG